MGQPIEKWLKLYKSDNREIKVRAARAMIKHKDTPTGIFLDMLDNLIGHYIAWGVIQRLKERKEPEIFTKMISYCNSTEPIYREIGCKLLGEYGDKKATNLLIDKLSDRHIMVRREAAYALSKIKDPASAECIHTIYKRNPKEDINVKLALMTALDALSVVYEKYD